MLTLTYDDKRGHWAKRTRKDKINVLLKLIEENKEIEYSELKEHLGVSDPTLSDYLRELEEEGLIEHIQKGDRRKKGYRIKAQSKKEVKARILKYESINFIDTLESPIYEYATREFRGQKFTIACFMETGHKSNREETRKIKKGLREIAEAWVQIHPILQKHYQSLDRMPLGFKLAIVQTIEK